MLVLLRICSGNAFHNLGAAYINALSPRVVYDLAGGSVLHVRVVLTKFLFPDGFDLKFEANDG